MFFPSLYLGVRIKKQHFDPSDVFYLSGYRIQTTQEEKMRMSTDMETGIGIVMVTGIMNTEVLPMADLLSPSCTPLKV
jgi:hypothetical protein